MNFINFLSNNYPSLKKDLENSLSPVSRELLKEATKKFADKTVNDKIAKYNSVMNGEE